MIGLHTFAEDYLLRTGRRCFAAVTNGREFGLVTVDQLKQIQRDRWPFTTVSQIARPFDEIRAVSPDMPVSDAVELMMGEDLNELPVVSNGELVGMLTRDDIFQFLQTRAELKKAA